MALPVSPAFDAAQDADVNTIASQVLLALGNYADKNSTGSTATSSGDLSADYPAAGAIDGDRTEINVGPASGAENNVGGSSWRSSGVPDSGASVWLVIDLGATRTWNRTKLYHLAGHGLSIFALEYWDGTQWVSYAGTVSGGSVSPGYGDTPYGDAPYGDPGTGPTVVTPVTTTLELDTIDHATITGSKLRLIIGGTEVASDYANVVELEIYRLIDVTDRTKGIRIQRQRDYKLSNNLAAACSLTFDNSDRYFSPLYHPTAAEIAAGFVNSEWRPGLRVFVKQGYDLGGTSETVYTFVGSIDSISIAPSAREATVSCRDGIKGLLDIVTSTKLHTSLDIRYCIQLLLNLCNVSTFETSLDDSFIIQDRFFTFQESVLTTIQGLVQACGDAQFMFDENGIATFRMYLNSIPLQRTFSGQADFASGTLQNIDTLYNSGAIQRRWFTLGDWVANPIDSNPHWYQYHGPGAAYVSGGRLVMSFSGGGGTGTPIVGTAFTQAYGAWRFKGSSDSGNFAFLTYTFGSLGVSWFPIGYYLSLNTTYGIRLARRDSSAGDTALISAAYTSPSPDDLWIITRKADGTIELFRNGTSLGTAQDTTYTTCSYFSLWGNGNGTSYLSEVFYSHATTSDGDTVSQSQGVWISPTVDQGSTITAEGIFSANSLIVPTTDVLYYTRTSANGIAWDAWVAVTPGATIASTAQRYIQAKIELVCPCDDNLHNIDVTTPVVYDITLNWNAGSGGSKYHTVVDFDIHYDGAALDFEQQMSDNLGGDTAILNDVGVTSAPLVLTGTDADIAWQGTAGVPADPVSVTNPYTVGIGTYDFQTVIEGGMDVSRMSGADPAAAVVTFGAGAAGSWEFTNIHPTNPTLRVTVTTPGTIDDLRVVGKKWANSTTPYRAEVLDANSISLYNKRAITLTNNFITNGPIALLIAQRLISIYSTPVTYIANASIRPHFNMQLGDRINFVDDNTGLNQDFNVVGINHTVQASGGLDATSNITLIKIP